MSGSKVEKVNWTGKDPPKENVKKRCERHSLRTQVTTRVRVNSQSRWSFGDTPVTCGQTAVLYSSVHNKAHTTHGSYLHLKTDKHCTGNGLLLCISLLIKSVRGFGPKGARKIFIITN